MSTVSDGYNAVFDRMLDHSNIEVKVNSRFALPSHVPASSSLVGARAPACPRTSEGARPYQDMADIPVYYSGPIDALFGYKFGHLPWRTLRFETETLDVRDFQGTSVVNYTEAEVPYTRIHEFKHYHPELASVMSAPKTIVMREYSAAWKPGDEPYYPVDCEESRALLEKYREEAAKIPNLVVGGRLGGYRYFDMDQSIAAALAVGI